MMSRVEWALAVADDGHPDPQLVFATAASGTVCPRCSRFPCSARRACRARRIGSTVSIRRRSSRDPRRRSRRSARQRWPSGITGRSGPFSSRADRIGVDGHDQKVGLTELAPRDSADVRRAGCRTGRWPARRSSPRFAQPRPAGARSDVETRRSLPAPLTRSRSSRNGVESPRRALTVAVPAFITTRPAA